MRRGRRFLGPESALRPVSDALHLCGQWRRPWHHIRIRIVEFVDSLCHRPKKQVSHERPNRRTKQEEGFLREVRVLAANRQRDLAPHPSRRRPQKCPLRTQPPQPRLLPTPWAKLPMERRRPSVSFVKIPPFLNSADGPLNSVVAEYVEPLARFRNEHCCVFRVGAVAGPSALELLDNTGSTRPAPSEEQPAQPPRSPVRRPICSASAPWLQWRWPAITRTPAAWPSSLPIGESLRAVAFVVTSGGGPGIMEAANRGAREAAGKPSGSTSGCRSNRRPIRTSRRRSISSSTISSCASYGLRTWAKALVVFPGGFGTLDEMFEILTLAQTQKLAKKITVVIDRILEEGFQPAGAGGYGGHFAQGPEAVSVCRYAGGGIRDPAHGLTENYLTPEVGSRRIFPAE